MDIEPFSASYLEAREKFIISCRALGLEPTPHIHPSRGPSGEPLAADFVELGSPGTKRLLIVNSATHGVEGYCGSAAIIQWLQSELARKVPPDTSIVLIHALNPYGFAWLSRVNEDNVDINRNFIDDFNNVPENPDYSNIHRYLLPAEWNEDNANSIRDKLKTIAERFGLLEMQSNVCRGQYRYPDGVFYGGNNESWSRRVFTEIVGRYIEHADTVMMIDFHTGLGPYGVPELISSVPPNDLTERFSSQVTYAGNRNAVGPELTGTIGQGLRSQSRATRFASLTAEFGTRDISWVLLAVIADNWLIAHQGNRVEHCHPIKREIRDCFYPQEQRWRNLVLKGSERILDDALRALAG